VLINLSSYLSSLSIYLSTLSHRAQLLAHTTALVRRQVLIPVPLAAVRRHLAPATLYIGFRKLLAPRAVAELSQLLAKALVLGPMQNGVVLAAVQRRSAPGTLTQGRPVLRLDLARRVLALSNFPLRSLRAFDETGDEFLRVRITKD
jgi:hypothetical protein